MTNGIAQRRWLELANPELCNLIDRTIGRAWRKRFDQLGDLANHLADPNVLSAFVAGKDRKKEQLFGYIGTGKGFDRRGSGCFMHR